MSMHARNYTVPNHHTPVQAYVKPGTMQRVRWHPGNGHASSMDSRTIAEMLEAAVDALDHLENSTDLLPVLDHLIILADKDPSAWTPMFESILRLLISWHVDQTTSENARLRIDDVILACSRQWEAQRELGKSLLESFLTDLEDIMPDQDTDPVIVEDITPLLRCFVVIAKAWTSNTVLTPDIVGKILHPQKAFMRLRWKLCLESPELHRASFDIAILALTLTNTTPSNQSAIMSPTRSEKLWLLLYNEMKAIMDGYPSDSSLTKELPLNLIYDALNQVLEGYATSSPESEGSLPVNQTQKHYLHAWLELGHEADLDIKDLEGSALGFALNLTRQFITKWSLLPTSLKTCTIAWRVDILKCANEMSGEFSELPSWTLLRQALGCDLEKLLMIAGSDANEDIRGLLSNIFLLYFKTFGSIHQSAMLFSKLADRIPDICPNVSGSWRNVLFHANPFAFALLCSTSTSSESQRILKLNILKTPNSGTFRHYHFTTVLESFNPLTNNTSPSNELVETDSGSRANDVLEHHDAFLRLLHASQGYDFLARINAESGEDVLLRQDLNAVQYSSNLLTYWACWEAARYCMLSRLRTPYGGPQQTFDAFERLLNHLLSAPQIQDVGEKMTRMSQLRDYLCLLDRLELQIYNASTGSSLGILPSAPRSSVLFFRANRKVCDEWYSRVRNRLIEGAKLTGEHALLVRHGFTALSNHFNTLCKGAVGDIILWLDELERYLADLVGSLLVLDGSDAISGLYTWCRRAIKDLVRHSTKSKHARPESKFRNANLTDNQTAALSQVSLDWINAAVLRSQCRYEEAAAEAQKIFNTEAPSEPSPPTEHLVSQIVSSYSDIADYDSLLSFLDTIPQGSFSDQTVLWSEPNITLGFEELRTGDPDKAWQYLEEFYADESCAQDRRSATLEYEMAVGQVYVFTARALLETHQATDQLERYRLASLDCANPVAKYLVEGNLEDAKSIMLDVMMLNTPVCQIRTSLEEFMTTVSEIPRELRMRYLRKDLHYWTRLDALVDLAKQQFELARHNSDPFNTTTATTTTLEDDRFCATVEEFKLLLSKVARTTDCHHYTSNIFRVCQGAIAPGIRFEGAKAAMARHDYNSALLTSMSILDDLKSYTQSLTGETSSDDGKRQEEMSVLASKIYLKLAKWSRSSKPGLSAEDVDLYKRLLGFDLDPEVSKQTRIENITAECLQRAIDIGPSHRKAWFAFGSHHYKQGWGILDDLGSFRLSHPVAKRASADLASALAPLRVRDVNGHIKAIFGIFVRQCASAQPFDSVTTFSIMESQLHKLPGFTEKVVADVLGVFHNLLKSILEAYRLSVMSYFRFLQFTSEEYQCEAARTAKEARKAYSLHRSAWEEPASSVVSDEITATLRLLRLLAKHGGQLHDLYAENLKDINVHPWTNIIPQLFARLDHPEASVQSLIADLLRQIGEQSPQLIVFHCVVAANSAHNSAIQKELMAKIHIHLKQRHPTLVEEVVRLLRELERVTVLREETWYRKLVGLLPEIRAKLQSLTEQYQELSHIKGLAVEEKDMVMSDNYQRSLQPVLSQFDKLRDETLAASTESNHERWFVDTFGGRIRNALRYLSSPNDWSNLFYAFSLLKEICSDIGKELHSGRVLRLSDLSPSLATLDFSEINIPSRLPTYGGGGSSSRDDELDIRIQSFDQQVIVIPTKTKPKKLVLIGSDGKRYPFLFKGLEDLHLDERVMQLLRITNGMLDRDKEASARNLNARHYAVVPLGDNSGMIEWVESTVSLFTLFAKWQHREAMGARWMANVGAGNAAGGGGGGGGASAAAEEGGHSAPGGGGPTSGTNLTAAGNAAAPPQPPRATDLYHEKVAIALKRAGLPANHPRKLWPKSILLEVYQALVNDTPQDLLEREIWASSPTPKEWWGKSTNFARSTAVMSMIGYVIGLGDRHLDNILIDFRSGDLVHIDYNVCFEKGKRLRIPEVVPFRLTRNIMSSLGVLGVEGQFRIGCEQALKVMRKNKEILVTLLEAFVYDPLVDWQIDATAGTAGAAAAPPPLSTAAASSPAAMAPPFPPLGGELTDVSSRSYVSESSRGGHDLDDTSSSSLATSFSGMQLQGDGNQQQQQFSAAPQQHQQQQQHQRNAYAVNILRRVRHKLEGRDFDPQKKSKVTEQVERVIQEATSIDNLAMMYEGWTAWI
ncbi:Serine/threonine-protein kinase smg1 [Actinomortierella ambigua]|uniref:non-specific serine/threonine protein kinase n=1 Tax=Actinomortierella ambigua TaxID=1343610 RepID=A0A9P6Q2U5_9FUNG|nr:Serine/threonine-protein kinase smg1 [Actinomortierella ambigua]